MFTGTKVLKFFSFHPIYRTISDLSHTILKKDFGLDVIWSEGDASCA